MHSNFNADGGETVNADEPGLLKSLAFWVLGTLCAVGFWSLVAFGLDAAF